jgi:F0F1-type ATP synthase beta subunit
LPGLASSKRGNRGMAKEGRVLQVIGPVVDVEFEEVELPPIYQALRIVSDDFEVPEPISIIVEVQQHLGEGRCRCVAMQPTEGLIRGMNAGPSVECDRRARRQARFR